MSDKELCPCQTFFQRREELGTEFWSELGKSHPRCECEQVSVSTYSPGPVKDNEILLSVVTKSEFISTKGCVQMTFVESRIKNGLSTNRKQHITKHEHDRLANELAQRYKDRVNYGSVELSVAEIRDIIHEDERAFGVYDTACEDNVAHAEIGCTEYPPPKTQGRKKIRIVLRDQLLKSVQHGGRILDSEQIFITE